eukprot:Awhi_evm1s14603
MALKCIFYSEFHHITGPQIVFTEPKECAESVIESFGHLSEYIIPKRELCHSLVTVDVQGERFLGFPILIENKKYQRNKLLFNFGLVFSTSVDTKSYELVCKKINLCFQELELENEYLSASTKEHVPKLLHRLYTDLTNEGLSNIQI